MKRFVLAIAAAAAVSLLSAGPALAKGPDVQVQGRVVIVGPGLSKPIVLEGPVSVFGFDGTIVPDTDLKSLLRLAGINAGADDGWYEIDPDPSTLGPAYQVTYSLGELPKVLPKGVDASMLPAIDPAVPFRQVFYPYAADRPLVYTGPDERFLGRGIGKWWSARPDLRTFLISQGLPATSLAAPVPAPPASVPELPVVRGFPWAIAFAVTGLLAMVVTAALAGRRAQVRRNRLNA